MLDLVWIFSKTMYWICVGGPVILDLVWERQSRSLLTTSRFGLEFPKSSFCLRLFFFFTAFIMAVGVIFQYVGRCRSHDMSPLSHIPQRKTGRSLLTPYMGVGLRIMYSMWWIQHRLHLTIQAAVVWHAPEFHCKGVYDTRHARMAIHFILHSVIGLTALSIRAAVLLYYTAGGDPVALKAGSSTNPPIPLESNVHAVFER